MKTETEKKDNLMFSINTATVRFSQSRNINIILEKLVPGMTKHRTVL